MSKSSPFIQDRAIPLYPGLALFLDYLSGVDDRDSRDKTKASSYRQRKHRDKETGEVTKIVEVGITLRGTVRALVLTQLDHRLRDNPGDRRLLSDKDGGRWYARSYADWHDWDLPFMPFATMKKAFQDLADVGYILSRNETDFTAQDLPMTERKALQRVLRVYNGKAFSIDYDKLEAAMNADPRTQDYYSLMSPRPVLVPPSSSDQADPRPPTSDQPDPTSGSGRSDPPDQADPTPRIRLIRDQQSPDQTQAELFPESSAASGAATPPDPTPGRSDLSETGELRLADSQMPLYAKLAAHHIESDRAIELIQNRKPDQIEAWLEYIRRANTPHSNLKHVDNPGGFLVSMLANPNNYPRPVKDMPVEPGERFLAGAYADEIDH